MNQFSKNIDRLRDEIQSAIKRQDVALLIKEAEELMLWHQSADDEEKIQAAALLDDIADYMMHSKEFALARMVIIGSLRIKGTLSKESGMTTFSYQQLEQLERSQQAAAHNSQTRAGSKERALWATTALVMLAIALIVVVSVGAIVMLTIK